MRNQSFAPPPARIPMTNEQIGAIHAKWAIDQNGFESVDAYIDTARPTIGCNDAVTIRWCDMWLCIETDGYTHT